MWQAAVAVNRVALHINISRRTVSRVWRMRFVVTGSCAKKARYGRPKTTTLWEDMMLKRVMQQHRLQSLGAVSRRIPKQSLHSRVARRKPLIGPSNIYAIKYDGTKLLVGMFTWLYVLVIHIRPISCLHEEICFSQSFQITPNMVQAPPPPSATHSHHQRTVIAFVRVSVTLAWNNCLIACFRNYKMGRNVWDLIVGNNCMMACFWSTKGCRRMWEVS